MRMIMMINDDHVMIMSWSCRDDDDDDDDDDGDDDDGMDSIGMHWGVSSYARDITGWMDGWTNGWIFCK